MRKYLLLLAAAAMVAVTAPARAGYVAVLGPTTVNTPDANGNGKADVGETFSTVDMGAPRGTTSGTIAQFASDGLPGDPVLNNNDLALYGFSLTGAASAVNGTDVTYTGDYAIRYFDPSGTIYDVSLGTFNIGAMFNASGVASLNGTLTETQGPPAGTPWTDLGKFGPVAFSGTYTPTVPGQQGVITNGYLNAASAIPEPGTVALLATGLLPLLGLRRRKA